MATVYSNLMGDNSKIAVEEIYPDIAPIKQPFYNIRATSAGWYRVATAAEAIDSNRSFGGGAILDLLIRRLYNATNNEVHKVSLLCAYQRFDIFKQSCINTQLITGIRWVENPGLGLVHLDVYYNSNNINYFGFSLLANQSDFELEPHTPYFVSSTSGETVLFGNQNNLV